MSRSLSTSTTLSLIFSMLVLPVMAEPKQTIENNQSYFTANLQKQPEKDNQQKIQNHFTFFTINIQINGKIKDETNTTSK